MMQDHRFETNRGRLLETLLAAAFSVVPTSALCQDELVAENISSIVDPVAEPAGWPHWRGQNADGIADGMDLPLNWSPSENHLWSVKLPGWGTSSPVVYGNRVVVTSETKDGDKHALLTLCFDLETGKELWRHDFGFGVDQNVHEKSNLAVNTPAFTQDALYVAFGNADIARYSHDGKDGMGLCRQPSCFGWYCDLSMGPSHRTVLSDWVG